MEEGGGGAVDGVEFGDGDIVDISTSSKYIKPFWTIHKHH